MPKEICPRMRVELQTSKKFEGTKIKSPQRNDFVSKPPNGKNFTSAAVT